jgi:RNA recognition motif-containing protein
MAKNLFIGNLIWDATSDDLLTLFQEHGQVMRAQVITDRETGRSRGFGFVQMGSDGDAERAIEALNGATFKGRPLTVTAAR